MSKRWYEYAMAKIHESQTLYLYFEFLFSDFLRYCVDPKIDLNLILIHFQLNLIQQILIHGVVADYCWNFYQNSSFFFEIFLLTYFLNLFWFSWWHELPGAELIHNRVRNQGSPDPPFSAVPFNISGCSTVLSRQGFPDGLSVRESLRYLFTLKWKRVEILHNIYTSGNPL